MKPRSSLLVIAAVIAAFTLGSTGGATAGAGLTKGAVRKIAAKVVGRAAPDLSVSHAKTSDTATTATSSISAATAGNADKLDNLDSTDLLTKVWRYAMPATTDTDNRYVFPGLPAGMYFASYDLVIDDDEATCWFYPDSTNGAERFGHSFSTSLAPTLGSIAGSAAFTSTQNTMLRCIGSAAFTATEGHVTFVRVDGLTASTAGLSGP
jgi:hypothetical protein